MVCYSGFVVPHTQKKGSLKTFSKGYGFGSVLAELLEVVLKFVVFFFMELGNFLCCCVLFFGKFSSVKLETKLKIALENFNLTNYLNCSKPMEH